METVRTKKNFFISASSARRNKKENERKPGT
jgi:hypothetical protein